MAQDIYNKKANSFIARNPESKAIYDRATQSMPGGNTRSVLFYEPFPLSIKKAEGSRLYDVVSQTGSFQDAWNPVSMASLH